MAMYGTYSDTGVAYPPTEPVPAIVEESFPDKIRRIAREQGWSEDMERFNDDVLLSWQDRWDESRQRFRSYHAPEGAGDWAYVEKPTESVIDPATGNEYGPWGDKMGVNLSEIPASAGGKGPETAGGPNKAAAPDGLLYAPAPEKSVAEMSLDDMQRALEDKLLGRQGIFGFADSRGGSSGAAPDVYGKALAGGGLWWGQDKGMFDNPLKPKKSSSTPSMVARPWSELSNRETPPVPTPASPSTSTMEDVLLQKSKIRNSRIVPEWAREYGGIYG